MLHAFVEYKLGHPNEHAVFALFGQAQSKIWWNTFCRCRKVLRKALWVGVCCTFQLKRSQSGYKLILIWQYKSFIQFHKLSFFSQRCALIKLPALINEINEFVASQVWERLHWILIDLPWHDLGKKLEVQSVNFGKWVKPSWWFDLEKRPKDLVLISAIGTHLHQKSFSQSHPCILNTYFQSVQSILVFGQDLESFLFIWAVTG